MKAVVTCIEMPALASGAIRRNGHDVAEAFLGIEEEQARSG